MTQKTLYSTIQQQINDSQNGLDKIHSKYSENVNILKYLRSRHEISNNCQNSVISDFKKYHFHSKKIKNYKKDYMIII